MSSHPTGSSPVTSHPMPLRKGVTVRPASAADAASSDFDVHADHWREGGNRRSFVAVDASAGLVGHCRGIDNPLHPGSRTLVLECTDEGWDAGAADALLAAQQAVSDRALGLKLRPDDVREVRLARRFGAVVTQLCPPWRRVVDAGMRAWAAEHLGDAEPARAGDAGHLHRLWVDHYIDQHAAWSPAAPRDVLLREVREDFVPGSASCCDLSRTMVVRRGADIEAAAILWPDDEPEVTLVSRPHRGPGSVQQRLACLAALVDASSDGDVLLVDAHLTERDEYQMMRGVPGLDGDPGWCALVAVPVPGAASPRPIDRSLVPAEVFATTLGCLLEPTRPDGQA